MRSSFFFPQGANDGGSLLGNDLRSSVLPMRGFVLDCANRDVCLFFPTTGKFVSSSCLCRVKIMMVDGVCNLIRGELPNFW